MGVKRDISLSSSGGKDNDKLRGKERAKKGYEVDSRLFLPMHRVISQVERDSSLVKSLKSLSYVRGKTIKEKKTLQNKKHRRPEELELNSLAQEIIAFMKIVAEQGDVKAYLVLVKLLLCVWEESKESGMEEFLLYMETSTLDSLGSSFIFSKEVLRQRLAKMKESQRLTSFVNNPRVMVFTGRPSKTMALEVQGEVACGIIGGVCVKPLHANIAYFEVTLKGSTLSDIFLGWKVCGSDPVNESRDSICNSTATASNNSDENLQSSVAGAENTTGAAVQESKSLLTSETCWVLDGARSQFHHACKPTLINEAQTKPRMSTETATVDTGFEFLASLGGVIDESDEQAHMDTYGSDDDGRDYVSETPKMVYKGVELTTTSVDAAYEWKAGTTVGCLLDTRTGRLRFAVDGHILSACDSALDATMHLGGNFSEVGVSPVFSCHKNAGLEFNVGQAPFKHLGAFKVDELDQEFAAVSQHCRPCYLQLNNARDHNASSTAISTLTNVHVQGQGIFVEGFESSDAVLSRGLTIETSIRLDDSDFWSSDKSLSINERYLWSVITGDSKGSNGNSTLTLSADKQGRLKLFVRQGLTVVSATNAILAHRWHSISVTISCVCTEGVVSSGGNQADEKEEKGSKKRYKSKKTNDPEQELSPRLENQVCRVLIVVDKEVILDENIRLDESNNASAGGREKCAPTFDINAVMGASVGAAISFASDSKSGSISKRVGSKKRGKQEKDREESEGASSSSFRLIASPRSGHGNCSLDVCEFRIWSYPLSLSSIMASHGRNAILGAEASLLVCLSFEEGGLYLARPCMCQKVKCAQ